MADEETKVEEVPAPAEAAGPKWRMRIVLPSIKLQRSDDAEEDDFKSWAETSLPGPLSNKLWYGRGSSDAALAKTSVTNGFKAAYNYDRGSRSVVLSDTLVRDLSEAVLTVSLSTRKHIALTLSGRSRKTTLTRHCVTQT
jgi:hypothetical protein